MKKVVFINLIIFSLFSCNDQARSLSENENEAEVITQNFDWLLGNWIRVNDKDGKKTFENWEKKNNSAYNGFAFTMKNRDTAWQENIQLIRTNDQWSFDVTGKGDFEPTKFKVIVLEKGKFICENQLNEFPKIIGYHLIEDTLHAKISGGGMEVHFDFKKVE